MADNKRIAVYAGSFNPFTIGHMSILQRGLALFDQVILIVGINNQKDSTIDDSHVEELRKRLSGIDRIEVMGWSGLTIDAARKVGAKWLLRGVRSTADYEYERSMADVNRAISGIDTVVFFAEPSLSMISSSMVRELQKFGHDISDYIV